MIMDEKPPLDEDLLMHFGVRGMHWGVRRSELPGVSRKTSKEASKDAHEFARAKLFYGEGAGTRRKLIKATVEAKKKQDSNYAKAFDHHLSNQNLGQHAEKARSERQRKDAKAKVGKTARGVHRQFVGPFGPTLAVTALVGGYGYVRAKGLDTKLMNAGKGFVNQARYGTKVDLGFLK